MWQQKLGGAGSLFTGACCLGFTPLLTGLSAIGVGFLINDAILFPLLALSLGIMLWGLRRARGRHGNALPMRLAIIGALAVFIGPWTFSPIAWVGLALIVVALVQDWRLNAAMSRGSG